MAELGVIGCGHLASYFIAALRRGGYRGAIVLSPRNADTAARIAGKHDCRIAAANDDVLVTAEVVLLSVRPQDAEQALAGLRWEPRHTVISAMAGIGLDRLRAMVPGVGAAHMIMPGSYLEDVRGPMPICPPAPELAPMLSCAGDVVELEDEQALNAAMIAVCASTWIYDLANVIAAGLREAGLEPAAARALALGNIAGPAGYALARPQASLREISDSIATDGTYTKLGLDLLEASEFGTPWRDAIRLIEARLAS